MKILDWLFGKVEDTQLNIIDAYTTNLRPDERSDAEYWQDAQHDSQAVKVTAGDDVPVGKQVR